MKDKYILKTVIKVRALIQDQQGKYLLLKRNGTAKRNGYKWELPGGKLEKNESFQEALYREVLEETGIKIDTDLDIISLDNKVLPEAKDVISLDIVYGIVRLKEDLEVILEDHIEFGWFSLEEIRKLSVTPQTEYTLAEVNAPKLRDCLMVGRSALDAVV